jgi:protocatechuate 3,4-dioxygenase beta subunit
MEDASCSIRTTSYACALGAADGLHHRPAQHIHYLIAAPGHKTLITQAYFATDPFFEGNPEKNWHKRNIAEHKELVMPVKLFEGGIGAGAEPAHAEIIFDIVLEKA